MTHANRAIHTHAASIMNTHIDAIGGLVSNPSDRETRGSRARAAPLNLEVVTSSWAEPHIAKRDIGQLSNRKLIDPSAPECRISAYVGKITEAMELISDPKTFNLKLRGIKSRRV